MHKFDSDMNVTEVEENKYSCIISDNWSVNGNPNGGYLMALIADAMIGHSDKKSTPIVTANYISRCIPGSANVLISVISRSKQFNRFEGRLLQDGMEKIRAIGTFAAEGDGSGINRYESRSPELPPIEKCISMPTIPKYTLFQNLDLRLDPACSGWISGKLSNVSENRGWLSFRDRRPHDFLSLLMIIDSMPPAAFASQGVTAWVPTIELSVSVRNLPVSDWLKCSLKTRYFTNGLIEADGEVWDEADNLCAISRQIAQFKKN